MALIASACLRFFLRRPPKSAMSEHQTRLGDSVATLPRKGFRGFCAFPPHDLGGFAAEKRGPAHTIQLLSLSGRWRGAIRWIRQANPDMFNWDCGGQGAQGPQKGNCPDNAGTDVDFGASPILVDLDGGHQMLLAGQKSAVVWGFDPGQQGKVMWQTRIGKGGPGGGIQWGIAYSPQDKLVFSGLFVCASRQDLTKRLNRGQPLARSLARESS